jgi:hypothetical protein
MDHTDPFDASEPRDPVDILHRVRVFVYSFNTGRPGYLLLRRDQGLESFWTPLDGPLGFGEQLESAVQREVRDETGIARASDVIDLQMPSQFLLGDECVVEWRYGVRAGETPARLELDPAWAEYRWAAFDEAFQGLGFEQDRAAILRLHTLLAA